MSATTHEPIRPATYADLARDVTALRNQLREERLRSARLTHLLDNEEATLAVLAQAEEMRNRAAVQLGRALGMRRRARRVLVVNVGITAGLVGWLVVRGLVGWFSW